MRPDARPQRLLSGHEWRARAERHAARLAPLVEPHLARRAKGIKHPVHDFLFSYYSYRPAQLLRWHPGAGVRLADAATECADQHGYLVHDGAASVDPRVVAEAAELVQRTLSLLRATAARAPSLGCFGMHEWAMVYRLTPDQVRHVGWPLRLGHEATDAVVEEHRITCSHFDAFRFFTPAARPLNLLQPGRDDRPAYEQPGCLHAGMDLYKHAFRLSPLIDSDVIADCFELAWDIRVVDMRAAPYDLSGLRLDPTGDEWTPLLIETPEGKAEYVAAQRAFAERGQALRTRLIDACERLLGSGCDGTHQPPGAQD